MARGFERRNLLGLPSVTTPPSPGSSHYSEMSDERIESCSWIPVPLIVIVSNIVASANMSPFGLATGRCSPVSDQHNVVPTGPLSP